MVCSEGNRYFSESSLEIECVLSFIVSCVEEDVSWAVVTVVFMNSSGSKMLGFFKIKIFLKLKYLVGLKYLF